MTNALLGMLRLKLGRSIVNAFHSDKEHYTFNFVCWIPMQDTPRKINVILVQSIAHPFIIHWNYSNAPRLLMRQSSLYQCKFELNFRLFFTKLLIYDKIILF